MRELSLFSGAGGGLLASHLLGWTPVGYVEIDDYCQRVIAARIEDGILPNAPIFSDIKAFIDDGYAWSYAGLVEVVTGGFPCQPFSSAARGRNRMDLDLWPQMRRVVEIVEPEWVFAENVKLAPIEAAERDLRAIGYRTRFATASAAALGAPHHRPRYWLVAHANSQSESRCAKHGEVASLCRLPSVDWWEDDPHPLGMDDGLAYRMDRLRAIGNGQVPAVARAAWEAMTCPG